VLRYTRVSGGLTVAAGSVKKIRCDNYLWTDKQNPTSAPLTERTQYAAEDIYSLEFFSGNG